MPSKKRLSIENAAIQPLDTGKLSEIDAHELLDSTAVDDHLSFNQIKEMGRWFLNQKFSTALPSTQPLPVGMFNDFALQNKGVFMGKLALSADAQDHYPVTGEVVMTPQGPDVRLHIVPVHFASLEMSQFQQHTDGVLALAAVAAVAPQFILALEGGMTTTQCSTKKEYVTEITPDHGSPLAVMFDAFENQQSTYTNLVHITGNPEVSLKQAGHLHGQSAPNSERVARAASNSKVAGGVPVQIVRRSELAQHGIKKHVLFVQTVTDEKGQKQLVSMNESLVSDGVAVSHLPLVAAALGFTTQVVGDSQREKGLESILHPGVSDMPLRELLLR